MSLSLAWSDVFLRLGLAAVAGTSVGINRGQHGRAAGLRTMLMVCTGTSLAILCADEFARRSGGDTSAMPSRFAQGILAGMGFLGGGVILREGATIRGVTTAAALWYTTILGICFGLGFWQIGLIAWAIGMFALLVLPYAERHIHSDRFGTVTIVTRTPGIGAGEFCRILQSLGLTVQGFAIDNHVERKIARIACDVQFHVGREFDLPQLVVARLSEHPGVRDVSWD